MFAHGSEPRLEISVERVNPGGLVEVRGVDFDYEESVSLSLMRSDIQIPLSEVIADVEGVFTQTITLPADLPAGEYNLIARTDHHMVTSPTITVWGAAVQESEDSGIREQSDLQLGAIPTLIATVPSVASTPLPQSTTLESQPAQPGSIALIYIALFIVGITALLGIRILKKDRELPIK